MLTKIYIWALYFLWILCYTLDNRIIEVLTMNRMSLNETRYFTAFGVVYYYGYAFLAVDAFKKKAKSEC